MTEGEKFVLDDANEFIRQTANLIDEAEQSTGIRPHPIIEESETILETTRFGLQYGPEPEAQVTDATAPGGGAVGACCSGEWPTLTCSVISHAACTALGGNYLGDGTTCAGRDCNSGACCQISGSCTNTQEFLCGPGDGTCDPVFGSGCWQGWGTTCAETRCYGMCCCPLTGLCTLDVTYSECCPGLCGTVSCAWVWYWSSTYGDCSSLGC